MFDNADYNLHTLDGYGTFDAIDCIVCVTTKSAVHVGKPIPRGAAGIKVSDVGSYGVIPISINSLPIWRGIRCCQLKKFPFYSQMLTRCR